MVKLRRPVVRLRFTLAPGLHVFYLFISVVNAIFRFVSFLFRFLQFSVLFCLQAAFFIHFTLHNYKFRNWVKLNSFQWYTRFRWFDFVFHLHQTDFDFVVLVATAIVGRTPIHSNVCCVSFLFSKTFFAKNCKIHEWNERQRKQKKWNEMKSKQKQTRKTSWTKRKMNNFLSKQFSFVRQCISCCVVFWFFFFRNLLDCWCALFSWVTLSHHYVHSLSILTQTLTIWFRWSYWIDWPSLWMRKMLWLPDSHLVLRVFLSFRLCSFAHSHTRMHADNLLILCCLENSSMYEERERNQESLVSASVMRIADLCVGVSVLLCVHVQSNSIRCRIHSRSGALSVPVWVSPIVALSDFDVCSLFTFHAHYQFSLMLPLLWACGEQ